MLRNSKNTFNRNKGINNNEQKRVIKSDRRKILLLAI